MKPKKYLHTDLSPTFVDRYNRLSARDAAYVSEIVDAFLGIPRNPCNLTYHHLRNLTMLIQVPQKYGALVGRLLERVLAFKR